MASVYEPAGSVAAPSWWTQGQQQVGKAATAAQGLPNQGRGWMANYGTSRAPSENPHLQTQGNQQGQFLGFHTTAPISDHQVYASQGAGAGVGQGYLEGLGNRSAQAMDQQAQWGQQQQTAAAAAAMRGTNTPGGVDQWGRMMQGLQNAQVGSALQQTPMGQAFQQQAGQAGAAALRDTNTAGGVDQWAKSMQGLQGMRARPPGNRF